MKNDRKVWKGNRGEIPKAAIAEFLLIHFFLVSEIKLEIPEAQHWENLSAVASQKENCELLLLLVFLPPSAQGTP